MPQDDRSAVELLQQRHAMTVTYSKRHRIAAALLHHVSDDSAFWNEIFEHAENAVRFARDGDVRNPELDKWCAARGFDPDDYEAMMFDALRIAGDDARSHALLIRALDSTDPYVVGAAILGLGAQHDGASRAVIAKAIERYPANRDMLEWCVKEAFDARPE